MRATAQRLSRAPVPAAGLLLVLLAFCAVAAGGQAGIGASLGAAGKPAAALALVALTAAGIVGLVVLALVLRAIGVIGRPPDERAPWHPLPGGPLSRAIAIAAPLLVATAVIAASLGLMHIGRGSQSPTAPPSVTTETSGHEPPAAEPPSSSSGGLDTGAAIEVGIGVALAVAALAFALRRLRLGEEPSLPPRPEDTALQTAASRALRASSEISDPRAAVIAAYAQMEGELAERGLERRPPEAPFEYVGRAGGEFGTPLERLAQLFELARFSRNEVDEGARTEAQSLLRQLRGER